ncbi:MAG: AMP-binding protein, partial [Bacteroidota bacterium]|nr:AMP-binding protein [Bacteroidota bacterium]
MVQLGGYAFYLSPQEIGLGARESVADVARVLSGYCDGVMARVFAHEHVVQLAQWATVPIINGLSDFSHPCQALADLYTIWEQAGKLEYIFPTAGAAMEEQLIVFFRSLGIPIVYGYGLTETMATVSCFNYSGYKFGSVGEVMPDVKVKIGDDNEILVKGKTVTSGYYKKPEATKDAFIDGWFRTGDAGKLDGNHLILIDRIKDLFKTSNGKYIAPQQIETRLGADPYIDQIAVIGNERNFVTAIIAPSLERLKAFAKKNNIAYERIEDLLENEQVYRFYEGRIAEGQKDMAKFEQIKKFKLIKKGFSIESGEQTSTLKLRRAVIQHNYKALIDSMYDNSSIKMY